MRMLLRDTLLCEDVAARYAAADAAGVRMLLRDTLLFVRMLLRETLLRTLLV